MLHFIKVKKIIYFYFIFYLEIMGNTAVYKITNEKYYLKKNSFRYYNTLLKLFQ